MSEYIWHWTKNDKKIYTRRTDVAEQAMRDGYLVMGIRKKPRIYRF